MSNLPSQTRARKPAASSTLTIPQRKGPRRALSAPDVPALRLDSHGRIRLSEEWEEAIVKVRTADALAESSNTAERVRDELARLSEVYEEEVGDEPRAWEIFMDAADAAMSCYLSSAKVRSRCYAPETCTRPEHDYAWAGVSYLPATYFTVLESFGDVEQHCVHVRVQPEMIDGDRELTVAEYARRWASGKLRTLWTGGKVPILGASAMAGVIFRVMLNPRPRVFRTSFDEFGPKYTTLDTDNLPHISRSIGASPHAEPHISPEMGQTPCETAGVKYRNHNPPPCVEYFFLVLGKFDAKEFERRFRNHPNNEDITEPARIEVKTCEAGPFMLDVMQREYRKPALALRGRLRARLHRYHKGLRRRGHFGTLFPPGLCKWASGLYRGEAWDLAVQALAKQDRRLTKKRVETITRDPWQHEKLVQRVMQHRSAIWEEQVMTAERFEKWRKEKMDEEQRQKLAKLEREMAELRSEVRSEVARVEKKIDSRHTDETEDRLPEESEWVQ